VACLSSLDRALAARLSGIARGTLADLVDAGESGRGREQLAATRRAYPRRAVGALATRGRATARGTQRARSIGDGMRRSITGLDAAATPSSSSQAIVRFT
jgi:hypothetical protein